MADIHVLDKNTIDQIAAGEVVERPVSVVKELVENAIDARAGAVTVEIRGGGAALIRVTDNGEGIAADQVEKAFARHATSKIYQAQDLTAIATLGFRGEALSSISAVSRVELITKQPEDLTGIRARIEGGGSLTVEEIGAPSGTTMIVRDLFFNTPARKKFLKTETTEGGYVSDLVEHLAISHPEISFKLIVNGQTKLHTSGNNNLKDIIYNIYGREAAANLIETAAEHDAALIRGYIGKPSFSRGNRNYESYYINGRYVRDKIISKAIEDAFSPYLMQHRYPFTALLLTIPGEQVDVNVHPSKQEVRFSDPAAVYEAVKEAVGEALAPKEMIPEISADSESQVKKDLREERKKRLANGANAPEPFENIRRSFFARNDSPYQPRYDRGRVAEKSGFARPAAVRGDGVWEQVPAPVSEEPVQKQASQPAVPSENPVQERPLQPPAAPEELVREQVPQPAAAPEKIVREQVPQPEDLHENAVQMNLFDDKLLSRENVPEHRIIGQLFGTYWLVEFRDHLYMIDQHAAHEKVIYERLRSRMKEKQAVSQQISPPILVTLSIAEEQIFLQYRDLFEETGFEIRHFGGRDYAISSVPDNLYGFTEKTLFTQMLDTLGDRNQKPSADFLYEKLASMACKAAVKGNTRLSFEEAGALIGELLTLDNPYHCPHGRPTIVSMSKYEIERKFKRIV